IVSAGTSDAPVLHEARIRAELLGTTVVVHEDVGVAGLHRLTPLLPDAERVGWAGVEITVERGERQGIGALHVDVAAADDHTHRHYSEIRRIVEEAELPESARTRSLAAFARLAEVEAGIHGVAVEDVHFHELGAVDTLVDVCGAFVLLDDLGVDRV